MADKRISVSAQFYQGEDTPAFRKVLEKKLTEKLDAMGAIGPYKFTVRKSDGNVSPHTLTGEEL